MSSTPSWTSISACWWIRHEYSRQGAPTTKERSQRSRGIRSASRSFARVSPTSVLMLVFVHIEKTGGRTLRYILRSSYGPRHCEVEPDGLWDDLPFSTSDLRRLRRVYPRLVSVAGHRVTGYVDLEEQGTDFRYFTILRDPLKMCASRYQFHVDRKKKNLSLEEWLQKDAVRNAQAKRIAGTPSANDAIRMIDRKEMFVGLSECFDESLVLLKALRAPDLNIGYTSVNVAKGNNLARDLLANQRTRQAIVEANHADIELYGHVREELYPAFRQEYGASLDDAVRKLQNGRHSTFNKRNLTVSRLKQYGVYKPLVHLYRGKTTGRVLERLLG